ncbi:hypothetical protein OEZ86_001186 [Tetradesmus obliquus]|nr:hypothetical protein OEZ86_001186 [Tetradesmus obliquus]
MSSTPVAVPSRELPAQSTGGVLGSSPRPSSTPASAARKFFKRLQYDASLDQCQFSVGLLETREQAERKSGAEAWSMRLHSSLLELPFTDFLARYGEDVPFHRIVWFKQNGAIVWEAENLKMKLAGDSSSHHHHHHHSGSGIPQQLPPVPALGSSFTGCSPPAGSFMARLAAGAAAAAPGTTPSSSAALPPRAGSLPLNADHSGSSSQHWKPQRHSGTDFTGSPSSWGGPGHWSAAAAARGSLCGAGGGSGAGSYHGHSPAGQSPLLVALELLQQQGLDAAAGGEGGEEAALADFSMLPEECWVDVLQRLGVKELCYCSRVSRTLRGLAARPFLWSTAYARLFGTAPPGDWSAQTVKRLCRRSELRASRWVEADVELKSVGFPGTWCCQMDDAKVLSGDGCCVRLWSHDTGRRIATLRGHTGRVTAVAFDDDLIISGCSQGTVKLWSMDELKLSKTLRHHTDAVSATALLHGLPISAGKDGCVCVWDAAAPNSPLVVLEAGGPVHALQLQEEKGQLISATSSLSVWDMNTTQLLFNLSAPPGLSRLGSSSGSSSSLSTAGGAAPAAAGASGAAAAAAAGNADAAHVLMDAADADAADGVLLQDGWLLDEEEEEAANVAAAAAAGHGARGGDGDKPLTCVSCHGNLVAAGRAGSVVLWDLRSQEAVGSISPSLLGKPSNAPCIGVQLDDWKLVTGWAGSSGASSSSGGSCWWRSTTDIAAAAAAAEAPAGHTLELYDIRAAASSSSCGGAGTSSSSSSSSGGMWGGEALMSLAVPNRVTCFQFHGQNLLVGQEGAECCLVSFQRPGSGTARAAAAWGYGCPSSSSAAYATCGSAGAACFGMSPGSHAQYGVDEAGNADEGGGGGRGGKGKKKAAKVNGKKQTRYPKRATR